MALTFGTIWQRLAALESLPPGHRKALWASVELAIRDAWQTDRFGYAPHWAKLLCRLFKLFKPETGESFNTQERQLSRVLLPYAGLCAGCPAPPSLLAALPQTGQTICWNQYGQLIACAGTGHDGDIQAGLPRSFTNNRDGTISDNATRLMWEVECTGARCGYLHDKDTKYTWASAVSQHMASLNTSRFAGYSDWRVPNLLELLTLWNLSKAAGSVNDSPTFDAFNSCKSNCGVTECSCTPTYSYQNGGFYWASTAQPNTKMAFILAFYQGGTWPVPTGDQLNVRAVRGSRAVAPGLPQTGQISCWDANGALTSCSGTGEDGDSKAGVPRSFTNNHDGTITDGATSLIWEIKCTGNACGVLHDKDTTYSWS